MRYDRLLKRIDKAEQELKDIYDVMYKTEVTNEVLQKMRTVVTKLGKVREHVNSINR